MTSMMIMMQSLADFEEKIRIQANRLMVLEDAMHGNVSCCQVPRRSTSQCSNPPTMRVATPARR